MEEILQFLEKLARNNNREWFAENKSEFDSLRANFKSFIEEVGSDLGKTDVLERNKVYRIYRDVRFSKNKTPYKTNFSGYFERSSASRRGGYFISLEPGNSFVGGGFYAPEKEDLFRIRKEFEADDTGIRKILKDKYLIKHLGKLQGLELKTAPRDFYKEHSAIDLIRKKQFYFMKRFSDEEVCDKDFARKVGKSFVALRPFFDYMSEVLTTDLDGVSVL